MEDEIGEVASGEGAWVLLGIAAERAEGGGEVDKEEAAEVSSIA